MVNFFKRSITTTVDTVNDTFDALSTELPLPHLPRMTDPHPASFGDDINLVLLVKEHGARKKVKMTERRDHLVKELAQIDKELTQLDVLLTAANSL
jgi:hypothetical protein